MPKIRGDDAIAGAFEELPVILVVLVAVSLFSVSVAHAAISMNEGRERAKLQETCLAFAELVRSSELLSGDSGPGIFNRECLLKLSRNDFCQEFNSTIIGFEYRIIIQCMDADTGNITLNTEIQTSEIPANAEVAIYHTCVNIDDGGVMGFARMSVSVWRPVT